MQYFDWILVVKTETKTSYKKYFGAKKKEGTGKVNQQATNLILPLIFLSSLLSILALVMV